MIQHSIRLLLAAVLMLTLSTLVFAQQQPAAVKNSATPTTKSDKEKVDPFVPTAEESALMQPVIAEFEDAGKRLNDAHTALAKTLSEKVPEVEELKILLAAKDARVALVRLNAARNQFAQWVATLKKRASCDECLFDEKQWKLVKPPAPDAKK